jgi:hypothetical protein
MLRVDVAIVLVLASAAAPASAQQAGPLAGPAVPSYNPGIPSYNPGVPGQAPGRAFGQGQGYGQVPRSAPAVPLAGRQTHFVRPRYAYPQVVYPYGYGYGATPVIVVPQPIFPTQRRRSTMDNPFFGDLGDPFF